MARPIQDTPVITGRDAEKFRTNLRRALYPSLKEQLMAFSSDLLIKVDSGEFIFKKLTLGDTIKPFKCNNQDLADFLINDAKIYLKYLRYTTFIIESRDITVAYYSLANDVLKLDPKVDIDLDDKIKLGIEDKDYSFQ